MIQITTNYIIAVNKKGIPYSGPRTVVTGVAGLRRAIDMGWNDQYLKAMLKTPAAKYYLMVYLSSGKVEAERRISEYANNMVKARNIMPSHEQKKQFKAL